LAAEKGTEVFNIRAQHEIEHQHRKTKMFTRVLLMTSGIAWLALVTTLMALNARDHIIAPNFTCLFQTCRYNFYKKTQTDVLSQLTKMLYFGSQCDSRPSTGIY
jgi:hypothetical protein